MTKCNKVSFYGDNEDKREKLEKMYQDTISSEITVKKYKLNDEDKMISGTPYVASNMKEIDEDKIDEITNQILNNKRITIKFYLHNEWHTNQGQCEVKYLDAVVMNYLSQMIPSTATVDIQYVYREN